MKKLFIISFASLLILATCQKKEEPKMRTPFPKEFINVDNEIRILQDVLSKDPKNLNAWIKLGNHLMDTSRFHEAIDAYQKALELDQKNVDVRVDMGTCYRRIGMSEIAVEEFRKAIAINPRHLHAHRNLGVVLAFDIGNKDEAIKEFEEYLRLSPTAHDAQQIRQTIAQLKAPQ